MRVRRSIILDLRYWPIPGKWKVSTANGARANLKGYGAGLKGFMAVEPGKECSNERLRVKLFHVEQFEKSHFRLPGTLGCSSSA